MKKYILLTTLLISSVVFADTKEEIFTSSAPAPIGVYSQAIKYGNTVYISGQIPIDPKTGEMVEGDFNAQVEQVLINVFEITKAAGGNLDKIVKLTVYLTDLNNFSLVNQAMHKHFKKPYPARAVIEIKKLPKQAPVEIEAIMHI